MRSLNGVLVISKPLIHIPSIKRAVTNYREGTQNLMKYHHNRGVFELSDYTRISLQSHLLPEHIQLLDETRLFLLHAL